MSKFGNYEKKSFSELKNSLDIGENKTRIILIKMLYEWINKNTETLYIRSDRPSYILSDVGKLKRKIKFLFGISEDKGIV